MSAVGQRPSSSALSADTSTTKIQLRSPNKEASARHKRHLKQCAPRNRSAMGGGGERPSGERSGTQARSMSRQVLTRGDMVKGVFEIYRAGKREYQFR